MKNKAAVKDTNTHFRSLETQLIKELLIDSNLYCKYSGISYSRFTYFNDIDDCQDYFLGAGSRNFSTNQQNFIYTLCRQLTKSTVSNTWVKIRIKDCCKHYMLDAQELDRVLGNLSSFGFITIRESLCGKYYYVQFLYAKLVKCRLKPTGFLLQVLVDRENKDTSIAAVFRGKTLYNFLEDRLLHLIKEDMIFS